MNIYDVTWFRATTFIESLAKVSLCGAFVWMAFTPSLSYASPSCQEVFDTNEAQLERKVHALARLIVESEQMRVLNSPLWELVDQNAQMKRQELEAMGVTRQRLANAVRDRVESQHQSKQQKNKNEESARADEKENLGREPIHLAGEIPSMETTGTVPFRYIKSPRFSGIVGIVRDVFANTIQLRFFDSRTAKPKSTQNLVYEERIWAISKDGGLVALSAYDQTYVRLLNTQTWDEVAKVQLAGINRISDLEFSPDGSHLAVTGERQNGGPQNLDSLQIIDIASKEVVAEKPYAPTAMVHWSTDGRYLLGHNLRWEWRTNEIKKFNRGFAGIYKVSPDGTSYAMFEFNKIKLHDAATDAEIHTFSPGVTSSPASIAFALDGRSAVVRYQNGALVRLDIAGKTHSAPFETGLLDGAIVLSPDGRYLVTAGERADNKRAYKLILLDTRTMQVLNEVENVSSNLRSAVFSEDGTELFVYFGDNGMIFIN